MNRHLYRCRHDRRIAGVAAGVAEFFDLDVTLVRILWFLSIFVGGLGILLYIGLALIVPNEPLGAEEPAGIASPIVAGAPVHQHTSSATSGRVATVVGLGLVLLGGLALLDAYLPSWGSLRLFWPVVLVAVGGLLLAGAIRRDGPAERDDRSGTTRPGQAANGSPTTPAPTGAGPS